MRRVVIWCALTCVSSLTGCTLEVAADLGGWLMFAFSLAIEPY